ncbi:unnamed protein product [Ectocarpus sp. CCAP 1310/34]|nr:unnamed protein product [Ectocarpus sp. CCAP 1310/34]
MRASTRAWRCLSGGCFPSCFSQRRTARGAVRPRRSGSTSTLRTGRRKKRKGGDVTVDSENPVCSPAVMSRLNPNGDALSRRQHFAAIKREQEHERKAAADKEQAANTHVETIGANMKRMVELKEAEAVGIKRENKIKALEKKIRLRLGDGTENRAELEFLLNEF